MDSELLKKLIFLLKSPDMKISWLHTFYSIKENKKVQEYKAASELTFSILKIKVSKI